MLKKALLLFLVSLPTLLCAYGSTTGSVELLFLKPTIDHSFYVINSSTEFPVQGKRYRNDPPFQAAFRLEGSYDLCDTIHSLGLRFTYFNESHTDAQQGQILYDTLGFPGDGAQTPEDNSYVGIAKYGQHFLYYGIDALFSHRLYIECREKILLFLGLHFAHLSFRENGSSDGTSEDTTAPNIQNRLNRRSRFWGVGPELGFDYRHCLGGRCGAFFLGTNVRAALLATHTWADIRYVSTRSGPVGVHLDNDPLWRVLPAVDIKVGLSYERPGRSLNLTYEIGYEFIWYHNAVNAITGYDVAFAGDTIDLFSNFNLQGPYLAMKILF